MQQMTSLETEGPRGNLTDHEYDEMVKRIQDRFTAFTGPLFTTDCEDTIWEAYLRSFPPESQQYHNCSACRRFIRKYGSLATINEVGQAYSPIWHEYDANEEHTEAAAAMSRLVRRSKITGVFLSKEDVWGQPVTGEWTHVALRVPKERVFRHPLLTAWQASAEKAEDFKNVQRALDEFSADTVAQALTLLNADALYRSEKVLGPAKWLSDLHAAIKTGNRANIVWRAIATAPAGFCHPRSSMIGTLLEDIAAGMAFETVARRFKDKMHPLQYQRPQAAPSAGQIAQAERVMAELGATGSLERRFARIDDIVALWKPTAKPEKPPSGGVFGHLVPKGEKLAAMRVPAQTMTWDKFSRTVLLNAKAIDVMVPSHGNFTALLTAQNPDAPPILQWDTLEQRNPVSLYVYHGGSVAHQWNLTAGQWTEVTAITRRPAKWYGEHAHHEDGAIVIIRGAVDTRDNSGNALFPETLKAELRAIRSTIEAYSRTAKIYGREEASACGINAVGAHLRVTDSVGTRLEYRIDRWD